MARSLLDATEPDATVEVHGRENRVGRVAAVALAASMSALVIGSLVLTFSGRALEPVGTEAETAASSGMISLTDDGGLSLFDLTDLAPGKPVVHCLEVIYDGSIVPVDLAMRAEANGELVPYLDVVVEGIQGGGSGDCSAFTPERDVFDGTLDQLAASGWLELRALVHRGQRTSYRISFELQDREDVLGSTASASLVWGVTPS